jgi:hypothetical protein
MDRRDRTALAVAAVSATVVCVSIVTATVIGDLSSLMWFLLAPLGTFGAGFVCFISLAVLLSRRVARP